MILPNEVELSEIVHLDIAGYMEPADEVGAENNQGQFYSLKRLCEIVKKHWHLTAAEIRKAVIDDVRSHIGKHKVYDDITLIILKQR